MKRFAYALLAAIWIAGIWIWSQRAPNAATPAAPALASEAAQEVEPASGAKVAAPAPHPAPAPTARHRRRASADAEATPLDLVRVRSSVGLPLLWAEVSVAGEDWQVVDLPDTGLEVEPEAYPLRVRAAGHLEADAPRGAAEIVLEPDALLTVESPNLRTRAGPVETLRGSNRSSRQSGVLALFPVADKLMVAFAPERLAEFHTGDVDVSFSCPDGRPVEILVRPIPGLRARYVLAADDLRGTAPLDVRIELASGEAGQIRLWLTELGPPRGSAARHDFSWGSVAIGAPRPPEFPDRVWGRKNGSRIDALALDRSFALSALDDKGNFGRIEFVHDGSDRTIVMQAPFLVAGRVVDAESSAGLEWPDVRAHPLDEPADSSWFAREGPNDEQGGFELHLPDMRWGAERGLPTMEPPEHMLVVISAAGHRSVEREIAWMGKRRVDLGTIALPRNPVPIAIDTSDLLLAPWTELRGFSFGDEPAIEWMLAGVVARSDSTSELELAYTGSGEARQEQVQCIDLRSGELKTAPFTIHHRELLLLRARDEAFAFRRNDDGPYKLVPRRQHKVVVQCERLPEGSSWTLGWRGGGTWAGFRSVNQSGTAAEWLILPEMATEIWWSAGLAPAELCGKAGGSLRLEKGEETVVLR